MPDRDVSAPQIETLPMPDADTSAGGRPADGSNFEEGYDEAQRAEVALAEGGGNMDGNIITDMMPDQGGDLDDQEIEDDEDELTSDDELDDR